MVAAAQRHPHVGNCNLCLLVEVYDRRWSCPPCRFTPAGGGKVGCIQVDVFTKARGNVEYDTHKGVGAAICLGYYVHGASVVAPQQAIAKLL